MPESKYWAFKTMRISLLSLVLVIFSAGSAAIASCPEVDLNGDCKVSGEDIKAFAEQWLDPSGCSGLGCADFDGENGVNMTDFALMAQKWQRKFLFISEFMASNDETIEDPQEPGEFPDWLEIYNASDETIDLSGMYLTDNPNDPTEWPIPEGITVEPNDYIIFWADDDDEQGDRHTNFKLGADGDDVFLFASDGSTLIDGISFDEQYSDISYGRYPDDSDNWRFMGLPTPGSQNNPGYIGQVADTKFSVDRGFYDVPFQVRIATDTDGAEIRYTLNSQDPIDPNGSIYDPNSPIQITTTTCLRAAAYKPGWLPSNIDTQTYIFLSDIINQPSTAPTPDWPPPTTSGQWIDYEMDPDVINDPCYTNLIDDALLAIPSICLTTDLENLFDPGVGIYVNCGWYGWPGWERGKAWERPVSVELINPDGTEGFQINAGLRMRGITSCKDSNPKHAFRLFFENEYDGSLQYPLFGEEGADSFDRMDLRCEQNWSWSMDGSSYHTAVREVFCRDLQRETGQPYTRSRYYHLYLNGVYWGLYQTQERAEANYGATYFGGDNDDYDVVKSNRSWPRSMECIDGNFAAYKRLWQACVDEFDTDQEYYEIQGLNTDGTVNPAYERLVDVDNLIDYMITIFYTGDFDAPISGWYGNQIPNNFFGIYNRENPEGFKYFRHDGEHAMVIEYYGEGGLNRTGPFTASTLMNFIEGCPVEPWPPQTCIGFNPQTLHQYLTVHPEYTMKFADHVHNHFFNDGPMAVENAQVLFASRAEQIDLAIIAESARWGDAHSGTPLTKNTWLNRISYVLDFLADRTDTVLGQLRDAGWYPSIDAPEYKVNGSFQHGGYVSPTDLISITSSSGTIYYTTDGSDPREPLTGNAVGTPYGGAITLNKTTQIKARAKSGSTWSALCDAVFAVGPVDEKLRVTEIMYHPQDTNDPNDPNEEFIELKNIGPNTINLNLVRFTNGIDFTFGDVNLGPAQHIVVVKDINVFEDKYGTGINVAAGQYTGRLANDGERIRLEDALGTTILDFRYKDGWRSNTDGDGYSLTIVNPLNPDPNSWSEKDSWRPSAYITGSPGDDDSGIIPNPSDVVINEVLAHSDAYPNDWIELHNTTGSSIDITGWFLSDDDANLTKYEIPSTTIPPNGYVVFTQDDHFGSYFALSENGEMVRLTSKRDLNGNLTGYRQKEDFGASENGVAFGRYYKASTDNYNFVAMSENTPGLPNAYPKVGPIVINEIMYHPEIFWGHWDAEYIELYNITASEVNLYDANDIPWKFTDGIEFTSPPATSIPAHSYLLVVKDINAFNSEYPGAPGSVQKFEWDSGRLNNDGEKVEISMPGDIDGNGQQQYIRIDRINYSNGSHPEDFNGVTDPWPTEPDGSGQSLERINVNLYGNDPNNWDANIPSPGS